MTGPVWITGARGFIGQALAALLTARGIAVVGFGRDYGESVLPLDPAGLAMAVAAHGPPVRVYHLAGGATVGRSLVDPHGDYLSNVATTECLLEALRPLAPVPLVLASSAAVYGLGHDGAISSDAQLRPGSPYGHHKVMAETLARSHAQAFGTPITICRLFSIYGAGLRKQLLFDACSRLSRLKAGGVLRLGGTGDERRDWLHVADACRGMAELDDPTAGEVRLHNLATGRAATIQDTASALVAAWGDGHRVEFSGDTRAGDPFSLVADRQSLLPGFDARIGLTEGLADLVTWFRAKGRLA